MFGAKVRISKELMARIKEAADEAGYSSVQEFVETALEREIDRVASSSPPEGDDEEMVRKRLKGLGYID